MGGAGLLAAGTGCAGAQLLAATGKVCADGVAAAVGADGGGDINQKARPPATIPAAMAR
jgi:hypothetical protein